MSTVFRGTRRGPAIRFAAGEVVLLTQLFEQLLQLLEAESDDVAQDSDPLVELTGLSDSPAPAVKPTDPVLARLLPDAYADDERRSAEFRRFTESELRTGKQAAIRTVLASLPAASGRVVLTPEQSDAWLGALNDLRLAIGVRLEVTEDSYAELERIDPSTPRGRELTLYTWLGILQETLVETLL
ncbi:MAG: DUF2017 domain-containing protein [Actinomycetes bacterium]